MNAPALDRSAHWDRVYRTRADRETSWFQDEPQPSLDLIRASCPPYGRVLDVGGGSSSLSGRLAELGFDVTVLDVSATALERAKERIGDPAQRVRWIVADVTRVDGLGRFDVWHDRAVFHFLTESDDRRRYVAHAERSLPTGGHVVMGAFGKQGPERCSGLPVVRYDETLLLSAFGPAFTLVRSFTQNHATPTGKPQEFFFAVLQRSA